jgi:hypothetical protein
MPTDDYLIDTTILVADIEQVLREKKPFILRCMLDGIKKRQGGLSNGPDSR